MAASAVKILSIVGARPQFIKAAAVCRALRAPALAGRIVEELIHTGQHFDHGMSQVFFDEMEIPEPHANLGVAGGSHAEMTGAMLVALEREMVARRPDRVLVYGDTNTTLAGALAAAKLHLPVAHVEAGLRSFNRRMPEEINRVVTDHLADLLFCPSRAAVALLAKEGVTRGVHEVGDVMVDALLFYRRRAVPPDISGPFALATVHRAENTESPAALRALLQVLGSLELPVILPIHPRTAKIMAEHHLAPSGGLRVTPPLSYFEMLGHLDACAFVLTDSGGVQKEAYIFGKRCVTLRTETEWTELVAAGANRVVGTDPDAIRAAAVWAREPLAASTPLYGTGDAGRRIAELLVEGARA